MEKTPDNQRARPLSVIAPKSSPVIVSKYDRVYEVFIPCRWLDDLATFQLLNETLHLPWMNHPPYCLELSIQTREIYIPKTWFNLLRTALEPFQQPNHSLFYSVHPPLHPSTLFRRLCFWIRGPNSHSPSSASTASSPLHSILALTRLYNKARTSKVREEKAER